MRLLTTAIAIIAALLVVAGQILSVTHTMAERHEICTQHGEVTHAVDRAVVAASGQALGVLPPIEHGHGCWLLTGLSAATDIQMQPVPPLLFELPDGQPPIVAPVAEPRTAPVIAVAPKTSPPAIQTTA